MFTADSIIFTGKANGGRHVWDVKPDLRSYAVLCMWLAQFSFLICSGCTKVSILFFYRRLVGGTYSRKWYYCVWFAILFTIAYTIAFCIMLLVDCRPTRAYWMAFDIKYAITQDYVCLKDSNVINAVAGVCAAISDLYAVALPCVITWHHKVPRRQRIALNAIFCLGFVVVAAGGVRTYWLISKSLPLIAKCSCSLSKTRITVTSTSKDVIRSAFNLFVWAQFELQVGIMCASAPALRVFFRRYLSPTQGSSNATGKTTNPKSIAVTRDTTVDFERNAAVARELENKQYYELHDLGATNSDEGLGGDDLSTNSRAKERDLTRYSHEEELIANTRA